MDPFFWLFIGFVLAVILFLVLRQPTVIVSPPSPPPPESGCASMVMGLALAAMAFIGFFVLVGL